MYGYIIFKFESATFSCHEYNNWESCIGRNRGLKWWYEVVEMTINFYQSVELTNVHCGNVQNIKATWLSKILSRNKIITQSTKIQKRNNAYLNIYTSLGTQYCINTLLAYPSSGFVKHPTPYAVADGLVLMLSRDPLSLSLMYQEIDAEACIWSWPRQVQLDNCPGNSMIIPFFPLLPLSHSRRPPFRFCSCTRTCFVC